MKTRIHAMICGLLSSIACCTSMGAMLVPYDSLTKTSDLIVIGVPLDNTITTNRWAIPAGPTNLVAIGVDTRFRVLTVLKGSWPDRELVLSHYQFAEPSGLMNAGPAPRHFDVPTNLNMGLFGQQRFLMFLRSDGQKIMPVIRNDTKWSIKPLLDTETP